MVVEIILGELEKIDLWGARVTRFCANSTLLIHFFLFTKTGHFTGGYEVLVQILLDFLLCKKKLVTLLVAMKFWYKFY